MRDVDERVAAVQRRVRRMRRKRSRTMAGALAAMVTVVFVGLLGVSAVGGQVAIAPGSGGSMLFGASSLFGPSIGGYVLVAIVTAVAVALITALCISHRRSNREKEENPMASADSADNVDSRNR